jgi:hypothetical protein
MTARTTVYLTPTLARLHSRVQGGDLPGGLSRHLERTVACYEHACRASLPDLTPRQWQALRACLNGIWDWEPRLITPHRLAAEVRDSAGRADAESWGTDLEALALALSRMTTAEAVAIAESVSRWWQREDADMGDLPGDDL